uniref:Beta-lactamase domain-containing protein n=1 Tax=Meloidogyne hapla TaxID=6305 RepID=A0A1I8C2M8_MELHA
MIFNNKNSFLINHQVLSFILLANCFSFENNNLIKNTSQCLIKFVNKLENIYFQKFNSFDFIPSKKFRDSFLHLETTTNDEINPKNKKRKRRRAMDLRTLENKLKGPPKCAIKNGAIYGEKEEEKKRARILNNNNGFWTQIIHPPSPEERDWVLVTGIERVVDGVLVCSLSYGGRLVSMGHFLDSLGRLNYYAIMHRFNGPVFLKPEPMTYSELLKESQENEEVDLALTQLCGQDDDGDGKVYFSTYWERLPGVSTRIWFPGSPESDQQKTIFEKDGFRLISLCGYNIRNKTARYVGIWQKSTLKNNSVLQPYEAHYGLTLSECLEINDKLSSRQYVAVQFRVFSNLDEILCCAIWEYLPGHRHWIEIGLNLKQMHHKFQRNIFKSKIMVKRENKLISSPILPRQISHFFDEDGSLRFVVLWSDVHYLRFPREQELWPQGSKMPFTYLNGVESQLQSEQLSFVAKRVERFMRELDIPGFGYSNARRRHLVTPDNQFRIGSVSKPITAAAVLLLIDQGRLELDQHVFGPGNSIFGDEFARKKPYGKWITEITVRHLLEHTAGGWNNIDSDPAWLLPTQNTVSLIEKVLIEQPLIIKPGKAWIYSNFGYQLLGYIIERVNIDGFGYEQFVKKYIWEKVGINDIHLARPTLSEKSRREVLYYMAGGNRLGFNPYDLLPAERIGISSPWGGWIASPIELLRLLIYLDGFKRREDILSDWAIKEWAIPTDASNETYGLGWSLNIMGFNGWQHDGRMPGSASMLVRLDNGISMAVVVNKEYSDRDFFHELGYILHHFGNNCDWWKDTGIDLFTENEN